MKFTASVLHAWGLLVTLLVVGVGQALSATIGLFSTQDCSSCNLTLPQGGTGTIYVRASTDGLPENQYLTTAEFRIQGLPPGWFAFISPNPETLMSGDPFSDGGVTVAFIRAAQQGPCIDLFSATLLATSVVEDANMSVAARNPPLNPAYPCPRIFMICSDRACDLIYCALGGALFLNSEDDCSVGVDGRTWSQVRAMYR